MTVLEQGIRAYVETQVTAAGKGYPFEVPVDAEFPAWAYETIEDEQLLSHSGGAGYYMARMELRFMADESASLSAYGVVKVIAASVRAALDGYKGTMGSTVYVKFCKTTLRDEWADTHKLPVQRFDVVVHYKLTS